MCLCCVVDINSCIRLDSAAVGNGADGAGGNSSTKIDDDDDDDDGSSCSGINSDDGEQNGVLVWSDECVHVCSPSRCCIVLQHQKWSG